MECEAGYQCSSGLKTKCTTGSSERGSSYCSDCKAGTFLNSAADPQTCDACAPGFVSKAAASACTPCEEGTFQNGAICAACPAGRLGATVGLWNDMCSGDCPPGTHAYRYSTKCQ